MKRSVSASMLLGALLAAGAATGQSVPGRITFTARLTDQGAPVTGVQAVQFGLFDVATGGTATWTETQAVTFTADGQCFVELGSVTPLTVTVLDGRQLWLELTVAGTVMSPRLSVVSVPYALRAQTAAEAGRLGSLQPADVQVRVAGTCNAGQAIREVSATGTVTCQDVSAQLTASPPLQSSGTTLALATCPANQSHRMNAAGTAWACANPLYTASAPLSVNPSTQNITLGQLTSANLPTGSAAIITSNHVDDDSLLASDLAPESVGGSELSNALFSNTANLLPPGGLVSVLGNTATFDAPVATYALCVLSTVGGTGSCAVSRSGANWRLTAGSGMTTSSTCQMMCFDY